MKVLVTGGAGFIGSHVVEHFQGKAEVVVLDNFRSGHRRNLAGLQHTLIEGSILDRAKLDEAMRGVDQVYHLAAMISVPESMLKPRECVDLNALGTLHVLEAAEAAQVGKVVLASSAAVYGDNPTVPKVETMLPEPKSPYAVTKLDGEYYLELFRRERGLATTSLRFFNVFGPRQDPQSPYAAAVPIFIEKAVRGESIGIFGDGLQTRDFTYVADAVMAFLLAGSVKVPPRGEVVNIGTGTSVTMLELARAMANAAGVPQIHPQLQPGRPADVKHSLADISKAKELLGFEPGYTLEAGLQDLIAWHRQAASESSNR